jgi:glycosyltransferase involved in cell wall biosynthesis
MSDFNYLITVHNKEFLLERVLSGVALAASMHARIIVVLDGCTDGSEAIARRFQTSSRFETVLVSAPDVHEIKSINIGLHHTKPGYCILLQDDVILEEPHLESLVHSLCEEHHRRLGYISFRLAADVRSTSLFGRLRIALRTGPKSLAPMADTFNYVAGPAEHLQVTKVPYHQFHARMVGIKSPVCLTPELRAKAPFLDENFAPYCYDDCDLSLQALGHKLINGLFPIKVLSDVEWGGTRKDPDFSSGFGLRIRLRNRRLIWQKHGSLIRQYQYRSPGRSGRGSTNKE